MPDSIAYQQKQKTLLRTLTIYGRKPVLEALQRNDINAAKLHLADSNKPGEIINDIIALAEQKVIGIHYHERLALSRISKNGKQDQGVALDIICQQFNSFDDFCLNPPNSFELIALDKITNPQNLGMIIRSVCASPCKGLIIPRRGCAKLDALVIKASSGTLFNAPIIRCDNLSDCLKEATKQLNCAIFALDGRGSEDWHRVNTYDRKIFILGNETSGIAPSIKTLSTDQLRIPMSNGIESLNVAIAASLVAFRNSL